MATATPEQKLEAQARVVGLLNAVESTLTGWVLQHDRETIEKLIAPLYELVDRD